MKKLILLTLFFLFAGCSTTEKIEEITVYEMESFSEVKEEWVHVITNKEDIEMFVTAISTAKEEPGIVDMIDPQYKVEVGEDLYFLWVSEDSGTIMNLENTHKVFTLSKSSAEKIHEYLKDK
ncbi:hypothetical protein ACLM5H_12880 [Fredinandcohnia humi]